MSKTLDQTLTQILTSTVAEVAAAVRANIAAEVAKAVGGKTSTAQVAPQKGAAKGKPGRKPKAAHAGATVEQVLAYIKKNPGKRTEEIRAGLGGADPRPALQKLRAAKQVKTRGNRRTTTYAIA
jgi:hypothetical protein